MHSAPFIVPNRWSLCGQDGFNGKTISFLFRNFSAVVTLEQHHGVELIPNPDHDSNHFDSLADLYDHTTVKVSTATDAGRPS